MSYLKHPLQAVGRWLRQAAVLRRAAVLRQAAMLRRAAVLRQAAVLGLGVGLLAGTGLIVTASVASAHSAAPATTTSHGPSRACALVTGRSAHLRVRPARCQPPMVVALASPACKGRLRPAPGVNGPLLPVKGRAVIARPLRLPRGLHVKGHGQFRLPVLRVRACASPVLRFKPAQLRLCRAARPARTPLAVRAGSCLPGLRVRPVQLRVCGKLRPVRLKLRVAAPPAPPRRARVRLIAPARACSLVPVPAPKH
ncbi:MAG TPA: hypothetical protein VHU92_03815 [Streptosporangiaceae bacterium]|nr:hypothetical protein [Streptosporangiaceae bacterium]